MSTDLLTNAGTGNHQHKWFPWQTKTPFEPAKTEDGVTYFVMREWAYLSCNCGEVMKTRVKTQAEAENEKAN